MCLTLLEVPRVTTSRLAKGIVFATVTVAVVVVVRAPGRATAATTAIVIAMWRSGLSAGALGCPVAGASPITTRAPAATPTWRNRGAPPPMRAGPRPRSKASRWRGEWALIPVPVSALDGCVVPASVTSLGMNQGGPGEGHRSHGQQRGWADMLPEVAKTLPVPYFDLPTTAGRRGGGGLGRRVTSELAQRDVREFPP